MKVFVLTYFIRDRFQSLLIPSHPFTRLTDFLPYEISLILMLPQDVLLGFQDVLATFDLLLIGHFVSFHRQQVLAVLPNFARFLLQIVLNRTGLRMELPHFLQNFLALFICLLYRLLHHRIHSIFLIHLNPSNKHCQ